MEGEAKDGGKGLLAPSEEQQEREIGSERNLSLKRNFAPVCSQGPACHAQRDDALYQVPRVCLETNIKNGLLLF